MSIISKYSDRISIRHLRFSLFFIVFCREAVIVAKVFSKRLSDCFVVDLSHANCKHFCKIDRKIFSLIPSLNP